MECEVCFDLVSEFKCIKCENIICNSCHLNFKSSKLCSGYNSKLGISCDLTLKEILECFTTSESIISRIKYFLQEIFLFHAKKFSIKKYHEIQNQLIFNTKDDMKDLDLYIEQISDLHNLPVLFEIQKNIKNALVQNTNKIDFYDDIIFRIKHNNIKSESYNVNVVSPHNNYARGINSVVTSKKLNVINEQQQVNKYCMHPNCDGILYSSENICFKCEKRTCLTCFLTLDENHKCNSTFQEIYKENTKHCPSCNELITKINGCSTISCVSCGLSFNWNNNSDLGVSLNGNPHKVISFEDSKITSIECGFLKTKTKISNLINLRKEMNVSPFDLKTGKNISDLINKLIESVKISNNEISDEHKTYLFGLAGLCTSNKLINSSESVSFYKIYDFFIPKTNKWDSNFTEEEKYEFLLKEGANEILISIEDIISTVENNIVNYLQGKISSSLYLENAFNFYLNVIGRKRIYDEIINFAQTKNPNSSTNIQTLIKNFKIENLFIKDLEFTGFTCAPKTHGFILLH